MRPGRPKAARNAKGLSSMEKRPKPRAVCGLRDNSGVAFIVVEDSVVVVDEEPSPSSTSAEKADPKSITNKISGNVDCFIVMSIAM